MQPDPRTAERQRLVLQYLPLCWKIVNRIWRRPGPRRHFGTREDLFQETVLGLMRAIDGYDPNHPAGACFITYAVSCIERFTMRRLYQSLLVQIPSDVAAEIFKEGERGERIRQGRRALNLKMLPNELQDQHSPADSELSLTIQNALNRLHPRYRQIIQWRLAGKERPEIGALLGVGRERVRQLEEKALDKLRPLLEDLRPPW